MNRLKPILILLVFVAFALTPVSALAADLDRPIQSHATNPIERIINGVSCAVVTIVTLPILILTGEQTACR